MKNYQQPKTKVTAVNETSPIASSLTLNETKGNGTQLSKGYTMFEKDDKTSIWE